MKRVRKPLFEKPKLDRKLELVTIPELCKGTTCKICISFCENDVLELSTAEFNSQGNYFVKVIADERCDECMNCYRHCPEFAIFSVRADPSEGESDEGGS